MWREKLDYHVARLPVFLYFLPVKTTIGRTTRFAAQNTSLRNCLLASEGLS
jgi:hypothetical protein